MFFENRVFKKLFWPTRYEVTGEWRKLHNEELNDLYCSPKIIGRNSVYGILAGKLEGKRPLAIHRHRRGIILKCVLGK
jgi:hypothetical protein